MEVFGLGAEGCGFNSGLGNVFSWRTTSKNLRRLVHTVFTSIF